MPKILVTGSVGFIGFHTTKRLLQDGNEVIGIDNLNDYYDPNLKLKRLEFLKSLPEYKNKFIFEKVDLFDNEALNDIFNKFEIESVINLAAQAGVRHSIKNPQDYVKSNLVGFANILENCRHSNINHLTYASTSSIYGASTKMPFKETDEASNPLQFYAATKKANELMAHSYSNLYRIPSSGLRFFTVYGPWGRPDMALFKFVEAILNNKPINIYNNGEMKRDFTYIDDIVKGIRLLIDQIPNNLDNITKLECDSLSPVAPYRVVNIGNSKTIKLLDFIKAIEDTLGKKAIRNYLGMQKGDVKSTLSDITLLQKLTNYSPQVNYKEGIAKFIEWYKDYYV